MTPEPRLSAASIRKSRLKQAKEVGYSGIHKSRNKESTYDCVVRLLAFAARTALVVFLIKSILSGNIPFLGSSSSSNNNSTTGSLLSSTTPKSGENSPKSTTQSTTNAPPKPPGGTPNSAAATTTTTSPAGGGSLRVWEFKNTPGADPLLFSKENQIPPYKHLLLFGDSTMAQMAGYIQVNWQTVFPNAGQAMKGWSCNAVGHFNLQPAITYQPPDFSKGEGPATQKQPFCPQCTSCKHARGDAGLGHPYAWEFILVEYARDVINQSTASKTTQETLEIYLKSRYSTARMCVVNVGLEDMLVPGITKGVFLTNLQDYLTKIAPHCHTIVWLSLASTMIEPSSDAAKPQSNAQIESWNTAIKEMLSSKLPTVASKTIYLDVFAASKNQPHVDTIKIADSWYMSLAKLFVMPIGELAKK